MSILTKAQIAEADRTLDALQKAGDRPALRWGQTPRFIGESMSKVQRPITTPATSRPSATLPTTPTMAQSIRASRDNTQLSGHQLAARKAGLDVNTPGIESMTFQQMQAASHQQVLKETEPLAKLHGTMYRR